MPSFFASLTLPEILEVVNWAKDENPNRRKKNVRVREKFNFMTVLSFYFEI